MALGRRSQRGGPVPPAGASASSEGARVVAPAKSKAAAERMRAAMTPTPGKGGRVRLNVEPMGMDFVRSAISELNKVHWPTRQQAINLTALVIGVSLAVGMILGGMDFVFAKLFQFVLRAG